MDRLNVSQAEALRLIEAGHNLVLLGAAGTGKSFLVKQVVSKFREKGVNVALTCTTGISCCVYPEHMKPATIHRWSGIDDGRYAAAELTEIITNNVKYQEVFKRIKETQLLIIDECSMMSKRFLETLNEVCSLKNPELLFGGIQVVLCGDFRQLPPVPNVLYSEEGRFCFESDIFQEVFPHKIVLSEVIRQSEEMLIKAIQEVSSGAISIDTVSYIQTLNRPLLANNATDSDSVKLFATNELVDDYNREKVMDFPGEMCEFVGTDSGDQRYLSQILAPKILWLKIGSPVILLRNLSDKLVNGLRGIVYDIDDNVPVVEFPSVGLTVPIKRIRFTVFSPRRNMDIAEREQYPLKLAYALTIHKSQGMTLDRVEVDCRSIFRPGQLGVALGRARTSDGLRVLNFSQRACIPQPETVKVYLDSASMDPVDDNSCCKVHKRNAGVVLDGHFPVGEPVTDSLKFIEPWICY